MGAAGRGASRRMKWGPHPKTALASLEEPSTLAAAEERLNKFLKSKFGKEVKVIAAKQVWKEEWTVLRQR